MKRYPVVVGLIAANVLVFAVLAWRQKTIMFSDVNDVLVLLFTGANFNPFTLGGQPWRLVSSMFMHGDAIHLLVNMMGLYFIGKALEEQIGSRRVLIIYLITGIAGGLASLVFNLFMTVSVGASGAIFGLYGYMLLLQIVAHYHDREALTSILIGFVIFLGITYLVSQQRNVDTFGHAGGFAAGLVLASWHAITRQRSMLLLLLVLVVTPCALLILPRGQLRYFELFHDVVDTEERFDRLMEQNLADGPFLDSLRMLSGRWDTLRYNLKHLRSVPAGLMRDTSVMSSYIDWRKREIDYHIRWVEHESYVYRDSIELAYAALAALPRFEHPLGLRMPQPGDADLDSVDVQRPVREPIRVFYDSNWVETNDSLAARYYRVGWRDSLKRWQGDVVDYYAGGNIQMKGRYTDDMHDGIFLYYAETGGYQSAGRYALEDPVGKWEYFYPNGRVHREVVYAGRTFTQTVYDTSGVVQVLNGNGRQVTWHPTGAIAEEGEFENGWRQGLWRGFYADGKPYFEEYYRDNRLVRGRSLDVHGNRYVYDETSMYPYPQLGMAAYRKYLQSGVRMAGLAGVSGVVRFVFTVDKDGSVRDFVVLDQGCAGCAAVAIRLVKAGDRWRSALLRGQEKVQSQTYLEVEF